MYASDDSTISRQKGELTAPQYVPMKRGCDSETWPLADGIVAYAYPHASTNFWNAAFAFPNRNLGPPISTGFTQVSKNFTVAVTAASKEAWLLLLPSWELESQTRMYNTYAHQRLWIICKDSYSKILKTFFVEPCPCLCIWAWVHNIQNNQTHGGGILVTNLLHFGIQDLLTFQHTYVQLCMTRKKVAFKHTYLNILKHTYIQSNLILEHIETQLHSNMRTYAHQELRYTHINDWYAELNGELSVLLSSYVNTALAHGECRTFWTSRTFPQVGEPFFVQFN